MTQKSKLIVGIDLGTTNSSAAIYADKEIKIIQASGSRAETYRVNQKMFPSVVFIGEDKEIIVGNSAKKKLITDPQRTIMEIKRKMGSKETVEVDNIKYTPEKISSYILKRIKKDSEEFLKKPVQDVIITVPAYFNDAQRQATIEAGKLADLNVLRILNEPTAACLAYGLDKINKSDKLNIMVFTFGGGTHDVTTMTLEDEKFRVLATSGDTQTGGCDIDQAIMDHLKKIIKDKHNVDVNDPVTEARLKHTAEETKIHLSTSLAADIELPNLPTNDGEEINFTHTLTQEELENIALPIVKRVETTIKNVLHDSHLGPQQINKLILVGGQTRMPLVKRLVEDYMRKAAEEGVDPMSCVAVGAGIQGAILTGELTYELEDVTPLSLGIATANKMVQKVISRNSPIPLSRSQRFTTSKDNQESVNVKIVQGERPMADDNTLIGKFVLSGIPPKPRATAHIVVNFNIDANGVLNVTAKEMSSGASKEITIKNRLDVEEKSVKDAIQDAEKYAYEDSKKKTIAQLTRTADVSTYRAGKMIKELVLPFDEVDRLKELTDDISTQIDKSEIDVNALRSAIIALDDRLEYLKEVYSVTEGL